MSTLPVGVVVMGVTGSGKTTIGTRLAALLGVPYADGDNFHSPEAIQSMASGIPLSDADREPWLTALAAWLRDQPEGGIVSCSALRTQYRDMLRRSVQQLFFLHLAVAPAVVEARLALRSEHFMPASLIGSQFEALEPLADDEDGLVVDATQPPDAICDQAIAVLARRFA
jgi:gluconokinase